MTPSTSHDRTRTRQRLLSAAGEVFAEKGFAAATVRDICRRAGANGAAVNYHFGGKRNLYAAVLEDLLDSAVASYPLDMDLTARAGPRDRLRAFIRAFLFRTLDEGRPAWHGHLMVREMAEPVALDRVVARTIRPMFEHLLAILTALLPDAAPRVLEDVAGSVIGQVVFYRLAHEAVRRVLPGRKYPPAEIERLADHITRFTLAALPRFRR